MSHTFTGKKLPNSVSKTGDAVITRVPSFPAGFIFNNKAREGGLGQDYWLVVVKELVHTIA